MEENPLHWAELAPAFSNPHHDWPLCIYDNTKFEITCVVRARESGTSLSFPLIFLHLLPSSIILYLWPGSRHQMERRIIFDFCLPLTICILIHRNWTSIRIGDNFLGSECVGSCSCFFQSFGRMDTWLS